MPFLQGRPTGCVDHNFRLFHMLDKVRRQPLTLRGLDIIGPGGHKMRRFGRRRGDPRGRPRRQHEAVVVVDVVRAVLRHRAPTRTTTTAKSPPQWGRHVHENNTLDLWNSPGELNN